MGCSIRPTLTPSSQRNTPVHHPCTLTLQEGKHLLKKLFPGSLEYSQLQNLLLKTTGIFQITIRDITYKIDTISDNCKLLGGFGASEHVHIGQNITLKGLDQDEWILEADNYKLSFSQIIALAGDFYAIPDRAISLGITHKDKTNRFQNAFNTLVNAKHQELADILNTIYYEYKEIGDSGTPHHCYSNCSSEVHGIFKEIKKDYEAILIDNSDHFGDNAKESYKIGHILAIKAAREAGQIQNNDKLKKDKLKMAYALEAFSCHFLTDLFASGHIRNQRGDLEIFLSKRLNFPPSDAKEYAALLTLAQHEKDGKGLEVTDKKDTWMAYGDGFYFSAKSKSNRIKVQEATQTSVNEIYHAYTNPNDELPNKVAILIPSPTQSQINGSPLYVVTKDSIILYEGHKESIIYAKGHNKYFISEKKTISYRIFSHALPYIPESYINNYINEMFGDFITAMIPPSLSIDSPFDSPISSNLIVPQWQRMAGAMWSTAGLSTYHQVRTENIKLHSKMNDIGDNLKCVLEKISIISREVKEIKSILSLMSSKADWEQFNKIMFNIKKILGEYKTAHETWLLDKQVNLQEIRSNANSLSSIFTEEGSPILNNYIEKLKNSQPKKSDAECEILVNLWFRQILELQTEIFFLWISFVLESQIPAIKSHMRLFNEDLDSSRNIHKTFPYRTFINNFDMQESSFTVRDESQIVLSNNGLAKKENNFSPIQKYIQEFEARLSKQIEVNKKFINQSLVMFPSTYINHQLEKLRIVEDFEAKIPLNKKN